MLCNGKLRKKTSFFDRNLTKRHWMYTDNQIKTETLLNTLNVRSMCISNTFCRFKANSRICEPRTHITVTLSFGCVTKIAHGIIIWYAFVSTQYNWVLPDQGTVGGCMKRRANGGELLELPEGNVEINEEYRRKNKPSEDDYRRKKPLDVFDKQIHQTLPTDVIGVSFDAQWYEVLGYGHRKTVGCVISELRGLACSST